MRGRLAALLTLSALSGPFACTDLFHSTDFPTRCAIDPTDPICRADAGPEDAADSATLPPGHDFCAMSSGEAASAATRACAWLGACEGPLGGNAFGPCKLNALLAFDCNANPNRPVRGKLHDYWDCLLRVTSCADVDRCLYPAGIQPCGAAGGNAFIACEAAQGNEPTRVACTEPDGGRPGYGESCLAQGETCTRVNSATASCTGAGGIACTSSGCAGTALQDCDGGVDRGVDCALYGGGLCLPGAGAGPACTSTHGASCVSASTVDCDAGIATGCPSGMTETVRCKDLGMECDPRAAGPAWDVSRACGAAAGVACTVDRCSGSSVVGCVRGTAFTADCAALGLRACQLLSVESNARAACTRP